MSTEDDVNMKNNTEGKTNQMTTKRTTTSRCQIFEHKQTRTYWEGNPCSDLEHAHKYNVVKPVNELPPMSQFDNCISDRNTDMNNVYNIGYTW
jgi:hypothetical protein